MVEQNRIVQDTDSIAKFGSRQESLSSTLNVSDSDALSNCKQRLAQFSTTSVRIDGLDCESIV